MDDVEPFDESKLDELGGDVVQPENGVIAVIDGVTIRNTVNTSNKVQDVENVGLDDFPGGENV